MKHTYPLDVLRRPEFLDGSMSIQYRVRECRSVITFRIDGSYSIRYVDKEEHDAIVAEAVLRDAHCKCEWLTRECHNDIIKPQFDFPETVFQFICLGHWRQSSIVLAETGATSFPALAGLASLLDCTAQVAYQEFKLLIARMRDGAVTLAVSRDGG